MSQPHPPIPEPQPQPHAVPGGGPEDDDPRTQSILLPPSQRQGEPPAEWGQQPAEPTPAPWAPADPAAQAPVHTGTAAQPAVSQPVSQPVPPGPSTGPITAQPAYPADGSVNTQVTGPVDFVPGFGADGPPATTGSTATHVGPPPAPGPSTSPGGPPSTPRRSPLAAVQRAGRAGTALLAAGLGVLALVLLELGLALDFDTRSLWDVVPTWSAFATVATLLVLVPSLTRLAGRELPGQLAWRAGAAGLAALAVFWVLVVLPVAASDRGFWLTAALGAAGAAVWLAPGRTE